MTGLDTHDDTGYCSVETGHGYGRPPNCWRKALVWSQCAKVDEHDNVCNDGGRKTTGALIEVHFQYSLTKKANVS